MSPGSSVVSAALLPVRVSGEHLSSLAVTPVSGTLPGLVSV